MLMLDINSYNSSTGMANSKLREKPKWLTATSVIVILLILGGIYLIFYYTSLRFEKPKSEWQAVFLSNGQVYFGHIVKTTSNEIILRDVFYLPADQLLKGIGQTEGHVVSAQAPLLVKLGKELHEPYDEMRINREHILFVEDLKSESVIMEAIRQYQPY